jgi:PIN domain nuclease of toxin-antitoxin system
LKLLLDTHILVWLRTLPARLSRRQLQLLRRVTPDEPALYSSISLWEIANLISLGRLKPAVSVRAFLDGLAAAPGLLACEITPAIAAQAAGFGDRLHRDPADRLIVATAIVAGATLVTSDEAIVRAGLVQTVG